MCLCLLSSLILLSKELKVLHSICQQIWKTQSAVATGLEKVSFHSNPKERQCQRMFKLPHNCAYFTRYQSNAQNSPSQASTVCEPSISRCSKEKAEEPEIKLPTSTGSSKNQESSRKTSISALLTMPKPLTVLLSHLSCVRLCANP